MKNNDVGGENCKTVKETYDKILVSFFGHLNVLVQNTVPSSRLSLNISEVDRH